MKNKIREFIISTKNNIFLDEYTNRLLFGNEEKKYIVNPVRFNLHTKKRIVLFRILYHVFILLSPFLSTLKLSFDFAKTFVNKLTLKKSTIFLYNKAIILTDKSALRIFELEKQDNYVIIMPPINTVFIENGFVDKCISSLEFISYRMLFTNYFYSLITITNVAHTYGYRNTIYSANSFEWYLMYDVIKRLNGKINEIIFSNQKDRWAILYDRNFKGKKTLLQHGTNIIQKLPNEYVKPYLKYITELDVWSMQMPVRYFNIDQLLSFTKKEADVIIDGEFNTKPSFTKYIGYNIIIKPYQYDFKKVVLLIGNFTIFNVEESFFIKELSKEKFHLLIKPHPTSQMTDYYSLSNTAKLVDFNPDVDIVVSYNSTLAYEYESLGYNVIIYKDLSDLKAIVNKLNVS